MAMFEKDEDRNHPVVRRFVAYWVATYGITRLMAGLNDELHVIAAVTYFVEAFCIGYELLVGKTMSFAKAAAVSTISLAIGAIVLLKPVDTK